ncbi:MAG: NAD-dependent epimerase/dehydratase family protein [Coriobacteriia bacterium]
MEYRMRILITGGAGFIGTRLSAAATAAGHDVVVLDSLLAQVHGPVPSEPALPCEFHRADCRDLEAVQRAVRGVEVVVHLAALTGVGQSMHEGVSYADVNCVGTATVLQAAVQEGSVRRVVLSSSRAVYGEGRYCCQERHVFTPAPRSSAQLAQGQWEHTCSVCGQPARPAPTDEDAPLATGSLYGATKEAQEQLVQSMCVPRGIEHVILRYFNVFGAGQAANNPYTGILGVFARRGHAGRPSPLYEDGMMLRDFIHVSDVVSASMRACEESAVVACGTWNVGTGQPISVLELATAVAREQAAPVPKVTGEYRVGDVRHCYADVRDAKEHFGFTSRVSLEDGLQEYLGWFSRQTLTAVPDPAAELLTMGLAGRPVEDRR